MLVPVLKEQPKALEFVRNSLDAMANKCCVMVEEMHEQNRLLQSLQGAITLAELGSTSALGNMADTAVVSKVRAELPYRPRA